MTAPTTTVPALTRTGVRQYSRAGVLAVWAAAAVPMGVLAWVVAPAIGGPPSVTRPFVVALLGALTAGLAWQFVLVLGLVWWEQRSLRPSTLRAALWLGAPSDATGRRGGRLWWWAVPVTAAVGVLEEVLTVDPDGPATHSFGLILGSAEGQAVFRGDWLLFALALASFVFNTVLGEELLFRGLLLPRMRGAFGRADRVVNALLFGLYHLHQPWTMPSAVTTGLVQAYATRHWRSAWMGILAHSAQSVFFAGLLLAVVVS
jgi:membrane protease YdiL (CAAX protease family)